MDRFGYPLLFAVLLWWLSTGVMLRVVNRPATTYVASLSAATVLLIAGLFTLHFAAADTSLGGVYAGFGAALAVWAWHEMSFLTGLVTGPRTEASSLQRNGRAPLSEAIATVIYHEFAIALTAAAVLVLSLGGENLTGLWTFTILWLSRLSAKVNVYLGAPNVTEEFLPRHLNYLKTYFCRRPMNMAFPISISLTTVATVATASIAIDPSSTERDAAEATMLATLLALALIEHWFLVLPFDSTRLWHWARADGPLAGTEDITAGAPGPGRAMT